MKIIAISIFFLLTQILFAQENDCVGAQVICSSESIDFNPNGPGIQELIGIEKGCLQEGEHSSTWFYFEIAPDAPANLSLEFLIVPENGAYQDYDFALYGPNALCSDLGAPIRCSFAGLSPSTGLSSSSTDFSEDALGDGYVAPIDVNPNEGYYLIIDNFLNDGIGFQLQWSGPAAPFLNCDVTPPCLISFEIQSEDQCQGEGNLSYNIDIVEINEELAYSWSSSSGHINWLSDPNILNPNIEVPDNFIGSASFTLDIEVTEFDCSSAKTLNVNIFEYPILEGMEDEILFCTNDLITIGPSSINNSATQYNWFLDGDFISLDELIETNMPGEYILLADNNGCIAVDTLIIEKIGNPVESLLLSDSTNYCESPKNGLIYMNEIVGGNEPFTYELNTGETTSNSFFENLPSGEYEVIVTDSDGCTNSSIIEIESHELYEITELKDTIIKLGQQLEFVAESTVPSDIIIFEEWTSTLPIISQFENTVTILPFEDVRLMYSIIDANNCSYEVSFTVSVVFDESAYIPNAFSPNDDGINDVFFIQSGLSVRSINYLGVYDRWGELVFESKDSPPNDPSTGWDGRFKDASSAMAGVYSFITEIELINGHIFSRSGTITIIE